MSAITKVFLPQSFQNKETNLIKSWFRQAASIQQFSYCPGHIGLVSQDLVSYDL